MSAAFLDDPDRIAAFDQDVYEQMFEDGVWPLPPWLPSEALSRYTAGYGPAPSWFAHFPEDAWGYMYSGSPSEEFRWSLIREMGRYFAGGEEAWADRMESLQ